MCKYFVMTSVLKSIYLISCIAKLAEVIILKKKTQRLMDQLVPFIGLIAPNLSIIFVTNLPEIG